MRILSFWALAALLFACNNQAEKNQVTVIDSTGEKDTNVSTPPVSAEPDTIFTAFGNEPFWALYVIKDQKLVFHPADCPDVEAPYAAPVQVNENAQQYRSSGDSATIELNIIRKDCSDGMSDLTHSFETSVKVNAITYRGCGRE